MATFIKFLKAKFAVNLQS